MTSRLRLVALFILMMAACAPSTPAQPAAGGQAAPAASAAPKSIVIAINEELKNIWEPITSGGGTGARELANVVNQHLAAITSDGSPTPRLLAELPSFEAGTWRLLPDNRMETTWKLRPGVVWHDGAPFTANDVLFSFEVNRDPEVENANQEAVRLIDRMEAADP